MAEQPPSSASRLTRRSTLGLLGAAGGMLAVPGAAEASPAQMPRGLRAYERYIAGLAAKDKFSGTVMLAHRGKAVLAKAYGMADKKKSLPNRTDTVFALASTSKTFTGVAIIQLVQQGKVDFNEKIGTYVDGFPKEIADTVTVHHLLTHTSGMGDYMVTREFKEKHATWSSAAELTEEILEIIRKQPLGFTPGTRNSYSNSGFHTLGEIVARASGQSYYDYVRKNIIVPAEMTSTGFYTRSQWRSDQRIAHPYWLNPSGRRTDLLDEPATLPDGEPNITHDFIGTSAGDGFSTTQDLVRFARALQGGELLDPSYIEFFTRGKLSLPRRPNADPASRHSFASYGCATSMFNGRWTLGHGGGSQGESTNWTVYRDMDWVGVILSNYDPGTVETISNKEKHLITDRS